MIRNTPNKRKSLAKVTETPNKLQKFTGSPKHGKSPKGANKNQNTPQKKFIGKQRTPKGKKNIHTEDDAELEENSSDESIEQEEMNVNSDDSDEDDEQGDSDEDVEQSDSDEDNDDDDEQDKTPTAGKKSITASERKYSVCVEGCGYKTTEDDLLQYFNKDSIISVTVLKRKYTKKSTGKAFINFKDETSQKKSLLENGTVLGGRKITVSLPLSSELDRKKVQLQKLKALVSQVEQELAYLEDGKKRTNKGKRERKRYRKYNL